MTEPIGSIARTVTHVVDPAFEPGNVPGHKARRLIDPREAVAADPFLALAEDMMPRDAFPVHPHRGMETVTYVLDGSIEHFDNAGHRGSIHAGDAQWMTAGRGVLHEENVPPGGLVHSLQLWINLAAKMKMVAPRYQDLAGNNMPLRVEPGVSIRVFSGRSGDVMSPTLNYTPVTMIDAVLEPDTGFTHQFALGENSFIVVVRGEACVGADQTFVRALKLAWLSRADTATSFVRISAGSLGARVLLFAGKPLGEPIAFGGPFVMNTASEIRQAFTDFHAGRF